MLKIFLENIDKLALHQKISHCFDDIMMTSSRKQHMIHSFLENGQNDAYNEVSYHVQISHQLHNGVLGHPDAYCVYYRYTTQF